MALRETLATVRQRVLTQASEDQRKAMFAHMADAGGGVGSPVGGIAPRGTRAGRFVSSGGINAKGQVAKTTGIHAPSYRHPGRGSGGHAKAVPFKTQVATKLGLTPQQLAQVTHAVKGKSPQRLAAGVKLHTRLATNAASKGQTSLAAQHRQAAALHRAALKAHTANKKAATAALRATTRERTQMLKAEHITGHKGPLR